MPRRTCEFRNGQFYQVVNKGKGGRKIFIDENDYVKFFSLIDRYEKGRVWIVVDAAVVNHFHFLLYQISDSGVEKFMRALERVYSFYFNRKYGLRGELYKGRFYAEKIRDEDHFYNVMAYILRNPGKHKMVNLGRDGKSGARIDASVGVPSPVFRGDVPRDIPFGKIPQVGKISKREDRKRFKNS